MITVFLDPGKLTGVARYSKGANVYRADEWDYARTGEFLEKLFASAAEVHTHVQVGWESFTITEMTARNSQAPWSLEVIGIARYLAWKYDVPVLPQASPNQRNIITPAILKRVGIYDMVVGKKDALSALQHLCAWQLRNSEVPSQLKEAILEEID